MKLTPETKERVELAGKLKQRLVKYFRSREAKYQLNIQTRTGQTASGGEASWVNAVDWFIHCFRFKNGDWFIDRFIKGHPDLDPASIAILQGWKDAAGGVYEIRAVDEDCVLLVNLVDGREYYGTTNQGEKGRINFRPGFFILTRLVPLDDIFLFSGLPAVYPPQARFHVEEMARDMGSGSII